jgi:hypothetical protein
LEGPESLEDVGQDLDASDLVSRFGCEGLAKDGEVPILLLNERRVGLKLGSILKIIDPIFCGFSIDTSEAVDDDHGCQLVSRGIINIGDVIGVRISLSAD